MRHYNAMQNYDIAHIIETAADGLLTPAEERALAVRMAAGRHAERALANSAVSSEEHERLAALAEDGRHARQQLIEANIRLVISIAKRYAHYGVPLADLVQEGVLGLIHALDLFQPERGHKLSTYAVHWIMQTIRRAVWRHKAPVRLSTRACERLLCVPAIESVLWQSLQREPTAEEIAEALGVSPQSGELYLRAMRSWSSLTAERYPEDGESGDTLQECLAEETEPDPAEQAEQLSLREALDAVLSTLSPREEMVLRLRYGLRDGRERDRAAVAAQMGVTPERVRQIELQALERLRHASRLRVLRDYL